MKGSGDEKKTMSKAYSIAQELIRDRLRKKNPEAHSELSDVKGADVIIVKGEYDHIENVLSLAETPFTLVHPQQLDGLTLRPDQVVFINCPGHLSPLALKKLETFVGAGGFLFTTDWALKHVLEPAFPGYLRYNERTTADEVVRVELLDGEDPFLKSLLGPGDDPQWWLEGSSYPIEILDNSRVTVLVKSREIEQKYGQSPVFVTFDYGEGKVYHMISHFYLQRSETRTERQKSSASSYLDEKGIPAELRGKYLSMGVGDVGLGDVESAFASSAMINKVMYDKRQQTKRRNDGREKK